MINISKLLKATLVLFSVLVMAVAFLAGGVFQAREAGAAETCPEGDGWVKVDDLSGYSYTYEAPEGYEVTDNCYKHSTYVHYGTGDTVEADWHWECQPWWNCIQKRYQLSHASFYLEEIEEPSPTPTVTPTLTPTPEPCDGDCEPTPTPEPCQEDCEPTPTPEPTPEPEVQAVSVSGADAPPVCSGVDLGGYAPTVYEVGRIDSDTVYAKWTSSSDNSDIYLVWYGLSEDNLPWNTIVQGEYVELTLVDYPNQHVWLKVAEYNCTTGPYSTTVDP